MIPDQPTPSESLDPEDEGRAEAQAATEWDRLTSLDRRGALYLASVLIGATASIYLLLGYLSFAPLLFVPLLIGAAIGLSELPPVRALWVAGAASSVGATTAAAAGSPGVLIPVASRAFLDRPQTIADTVEGFLSDYLAGRFNYGILATARPLELVLAVTGLCCVTAFGIGWLKRRTEARPRAITAMAAVAAFVLAGVFVAGAYHDSAGARAAAAAEPVDYGYSHDSVIYQKTYYLMQRGEGYYPAVVAAISHDARVAKDPAVKKGDISSFWPTAAYFRQPLAFYVWKYLAPGGTDSVFWLSFALSGLVLIGLWWGLLPHVGHRSLLVALIVAPILTMYNVWGNVFFPDWWAALAIVYTVVFLARGNRLAAALAATVASSFRFTALPMLALILGLTVYDALRDRRARPAAVIATALSGAFGLSWVAHTRLADRFIGATASARASTEGILAATANKPLSVRLLGPTDFGMYPYGSVYFETAWLFAPALAGFGVIGRRDRGAAIVLMAYVAAWLVFLATVGAPSTYWGQLVMPVVVVGAALLACGLEILVCGTAPDAVA